MTSHCPSDLTYTFYWGRVCLSLVGVATHGGWQCCMAIICFSAREKRPHPDTWKAVSLCKTGRLTCFSSSSCAFFFFPLVFVADVTNYFLTNNLLPTVYLHYRLLGVTVLHHKLLDHSNLLLRQENVSHNQKVGSGSGCFLLRVVSPTTSNHVSIALQVHLKVDYVLLPYH